MKKPTFFEFREIFLEEFARLSGKPAREAACTGWSEGLEENVRKSLLESVKNRLSERSEVAYEVNDRLLKAPGTVESAVVQAFHELNTIWLMERINEKIRAKRRQLMEN